ncbi:MAG: hypothetical protein JRG73_02575 [Deltaproteobacteria bacterium]|nr:hypothetical protein [Deltaproteobacteria bacterium]
MARTTSRPDREATRVFTRCTPRPGTGEAIIASIRACLASLDPHCK